MVTFAVRDDVGGLHLPQIDCGVFAAVNGDDVRGMIVHGGGRQLDAGFVVVSHLHPLREHEVARDQHAAHAHRAAAEQQKQNGQQDAKRALSALSGAARVLLHRRGGVCTRRGMYSSSVSAP